MKIEFKTVEEHGMPDPYQPVIARLSIGAVVILTSNFEKEWCKDTIQSIVYGCNDGMEPIDKAHKVIGWSYIY